MNDFFPVILGMFENCFALVKRFGDFEPLLGEQNHAKLVGNLAAERDLIHFPLVRTVHMLETDDPTIAAS